MKELIDELDPQFEDFCMEVCSGCVNAQRGCFPSEDCSKCCCWEEFGEARKLFSKLRYIEDDPDHIFGDPNDDEHYDFNASSEAWFAADDELKKLKEVMFDVTGENLTEYYQYYGYEL